MTEINSIPAFGTDDRKRAYSFIFVVALIASCFLWEGCSAVPQSSALPVKGTSQHSVSTMVLPEATVGTGYQTALSSGETTAPEFVVTQGALPAGLTLNAFAGVISGTPTKGGTFAFTVIVKTDGHGVTSACTYTLTVKASSAAKTVKVQVLPASTTVASGGRVQFSAAVQNTSNTGVTWSASAGSISSSGWLTIPSVTSLASITVTATSTADPSIHGTATAAISSAPPAFTIATTSLPAGTQSATYSVSLLASGGEAPYQWSIIAGSLPLGLQLNRTGTLSGTTAIAGTFNFTVQGMDATLQKAQHSYSLVISSSGSGPGNCGPPAYGCSRTDGAIVPVPSTPPNVGNLLGANTIVSDPDFSNRIVRITDGNTDPHAPFQNRTFMTASSGSADENLWNLDSTMLVVQDTGARGYLFAFNPSTMQASRMYASAVPRTNGFTFPGSGTWSHVNPNILYATEGTTIVKYDFSDRTTPPAPQPFFNFASGANCLPAGFNPTWQTRGGVSADDSVIGMGYSNAGSQQTAVYAVVYKAGSGCTVLNTQTGQVWGDWGARGTINIPDRWLIHNVKISKDGNWLVVAKAECLSSSCSVGPFFWQIGTTNVSSCGAGRHCGGHWTEGYTHWVNNNQTPVSNQVIRLFDVPSSVMDLTHYFPTGLTSNLDQHQSWNNVDPNDSVPLFSTTRSPTTPFPAPWYNEIIGLAPDGSGTIWRFAHNFITTHSQWFSVEEGIGSVSQDGKFFMFSSDWMGTLGSESGTATCTVGTNCRGDVFVVELK